jgi:predicted nucleic acid-binding protein
MSSRLLAVELRRLARRVERIARGEALLTDVRLLPMDDPILHVAERLGPTNLGTLDAIHLATALLLAEDEILDTVLTYDARLADAARDHGLTVLAPT